MILIEFLSILSGSEQQQGIKYYRNLNLKEVVTPVDADKLESLLTEIEYNRAETKFLCDGFRDGFELGYEGEPEFRQDVSDNIPFTIGNSTILWNKLMDEVKEGRVAGPFTEIPYKHTFIQSPIGLVPKAGNKTRLIFHLSYDFKNENKSVNHWIPEHKCSIHYNDLDKAIKDCLTLMKTLGIQTLYFSKSDLKSAFRILGILPKDRCYLIMKARDPMNNSVWLYFVDKCLPFGASISCAHFQRFSNALRTIVERKASMLLVNKVQMTLITNYLDDFLFVYISIYGCNGIVHVFLDVCKHIGFPVALEKTEWGTDQIVFLGMLLDGKRHTISISEERRVQILHLVQRFKDKRKATIKDLQSLARHLNFVNRAIVPGRAFTRRMYAKFTGKNIMSNSGRLLKPHHHVKIDAEFRLDCQMWELFLKDVSAVTRPFVDLSITLVADTLNFFSDASANKTLGYGAVFGNNWMFGQWEHGFIEKCEPSIKFLELFALCAALLTWNRDPKLNKARIVIFCDNISVVHMVNKLSSSCGQCMKLIRILTLDNLKHDRRVFVKHVKGKNNSLSDSLSRLDFDRFWRLALTTMNKFATKTSEVIWPVSKIWDSQTI